MGFSLKGSFKGTDGQDAPAVKVQYSVNGTSSWHTTFASGDKYMRISTDGGSTWGNAAKIVGEDGTDGSYVEYDFAKNSSETSAPTSGWQGSPPSITSTQYLWMRKRTVNSNGNPGSWSTPVRISGPKGAKGQRGNKHYFGDGAPVDSDYPNAITGDEYTDLLNFQLYVWQD